MTISAAAPGDLPAIRALLEAGGLPAADLAPAHLDAFWVVRDAGGLAGVVGLEPRGHAALLRSLAVRADRRGHGVGAELLARAEAEAHARGVAALYLLTTSAERFFARRGYDVADRGTAPMEIRATREFADLCPASSVCMTKRLGA